VSASGRRGSLPPRGYRPAPRLLDNAGFRVRFVPEDRSEQAVEFDFTSWRVSRELRVAFAAAFSKRTRPGGRVRTVESAAKTFRHLRRFSDYLADLLAPPTSASQLTPAHLSGWFLPRQHRRGGSIELGELKTTLRKMEGISREFHAALVEPNPPRIRFPGKSSYSRSENQRILTAARRDVRAAAQRIRGNRALLQRWRDGQSDEEPEAVRRTCELLDHVDRTGDVPRTGGAPSFWVSSLGPVREHVTALHLSADEAAAFAVLLVGLTGQNRSTILKAPAAHHRPDGYTGNAPSAIIELDKPRRGARRHMDVALTSIPTWLDAGHRAATEGPEEAEGSHEPAGLDLRSAFGVYMLLNELAAPARRHLGSDRLFAWWVGTGGGGVGRGFRQVLHPDVVLSWGRCRVLPTDTAVAARGGNCVGEPGVSGLADEQLTVRLDRLRLTYAELQQRPVAHTERTLANEYLARNRGNLVEYQKVVAAALTEQVAKATARGRMHTLSSADIAEARQHPAEVAARYGIDEATLQRMLAGELDTVLGACIDHTSSPHTTAGQACRASFMLCLSCPCARATPSHLPVQVLVHDELEHRRSTIVRVRVLMSL
jgi:hypothetical protein